MKQPYSVEYIAGLERLLEAAADQLADVHTGSDFECECWDIARQARRWMHPEQFAKEDE